MRFDLTKQRGLTIKAVFSSEIGVKANATGKKDEQMQDAYEACASCVKTSELLGLSEMRPSETAARGLR